MSRFEDLSKEVQMKFMMIDDLKIPVYDYYIDDTKNNKETEWTNDLIEKYIKDFSLENIRDPNRRLPEPYEKGSHLHYLALSKYLKSNVIKAAVIGSIDPWIEAILINFGIKDITTVEYNVPKCSIIKTISYDDFVSQEKNTYDLILSYSSIEHSGLGRYGDPINPNGDLETMEQIYKKLKTDGIVLLGIPVGKDGLAWNAHRIYGHHRLSLLFKNFKELEWIGLDKTFLDIVGYQNNGPQPLIVLKKE